MKIGISTSCLYPMYTEDALLQIAKNGVGLTEIFFNANCELQEPFVQKLKAIKDEYGIQIGSVHPTMSLAESFMLFSNYDRRYAEGIETYKRYAQIAATLGAKYIIMHGGKPNNAIDDLEYFERFQKVAECVKQNGAVLLQENVVRFRAGNIDTLCKMSDFLGENAAFCLDVKQALRGGYSPYDVLQKLGGKIKHLHLSDSTPDNDCMLPLNGNFDFKKFLATAKKCGFEGNAVVEVYRNAYGNFEELFNSYKKLIRSVFE